MGYHIFLSFLPAGLPAGRNREGRGARCNVPLLDREDRRVRNDMNSCYAQGLIIWSLLRGQLIEIF